MLSTLRSPDKSVNTRKNINIFLLGLAFLLVFTAFQTMSNIQTVILDNAQDDESEGYEPGFEGDGFIALCIIYGVSAVANWFAPSVMTVIGLKFTMILGSVWYATYIASFFYLNEALLYSASAMLGIGAALIWTAQGAFLTVNSEEATMSRNSGIFWAMFQCSLLIGNTFAYFQFKEDDDISEEERTVFVAVLFTAGCAGVVVFFFLLPTPWDKDMRADQKPDTPKTAFLRSIKLFTTPEMLQLVFFFFYMGMQLTFWSGVYGPCLGFTQKFDDPKSLAALHGIMIGVGEILGGLIFGIFGKVTNRLGRSPIVVLGTIVQFIAFVGIFFNIPNDAPLEEGGDSDTWSDPIITPPWEWLAIVCSLLLGFGDACYNTQTMSLLGGVYPDEAGPAFAIFKFVQSIAACAGFAYSGEVPLYWHIGMLWALGTVGTILFVKIDLETRKKESRWAKIEKDKVPEKEGDGVSNEGMDTDHDEEKKPS